MVLANWKLQVYYADRNAVYTGYRSGATWFRLPFRIHQKQIETVRRNLISSGGIDIITHFAHVERRPVLK